MREWIFCRISRSLLYAGGLAIAPLTAQASAGARGGALVGKPR